ncbi:anti-anti-sigma factor [Streptomyces kebangsaanensis]|uniref:Anti-anti-sigma factor n=1 Tax=Streptomyces kebangsaanensis TaxID=864058 RepID=A0ABW6KKW3_9ACTN|nr:anti-anti-sigma factor [Streptomyces kebangsaanensis]
MREGEDVYYLELSAVTFVDVAGAGVLADAAPRFGPGRRTVPRRAEELFRSGLPGIEVSTS